MKKPSIPLGLVFSQSGPYAMMAGEMRKSALMAVDEINQSDAFDFVFAPHLRDPGGVVAAYHTACDGAHSRRACRPHRRLLHLGVAQAGHSHRRAHRTAALASGAIRRIRKQRQRYLCRGRAQPARRAAGAAHAGQHRRRRVLHRIQLCLDLGNQPGHSRNRHQRRRPHSRRTPAGVRRNRGRPHREGDHRAKAAGGFQHAGRRIQLCLHARAAPGGNARRIFRSPC